MTECSFNMSICTHFFHRQKNIKNNEMNIKVQIETKATNQKLIQAIRLVNYIGNEINRMSRMLFVVLIIGSNMESIAQISTNFSNFTFYDSNSTTDDLHYDYGWTRSSSNVTLQSNGMVLEPVTSNVPESFTTGTYNLSGSDSIKFSHRITNTGGSGAKTLVIKLIDIMTNGVTVIDTIHYVNASQQNFATKTLNISQVGLYRIQFEFLNSNIVGSSPQVIVNTFFSSSTPMLLSLFVDNFNAALQGNNVIVNWEMFSEVIVKSYELEYAVNDDKFERIGVVISNANALKPAKYEFVHYGPDTKIPFTVLYYRIKIIDVAGNFMYSKMIELYYNSVPKISKVIFQNPITEYLVLQFDDPSYFSNMKIKDSQGRVVLTCQNYFHPSTLQVNTVNLVPGTYFLCLMFNNGSVETHKIIKM